MQFAIGALVALPLLSYIIWRGATGIIWRGATGKALIAGLTLSACLGLVLVFMMRWNMVIGGQEISKTGMGLLSYQMPRLVAQRVDSLEQVPRAYRTGAHKSTAMAAMSALMMEVDVRDLAAHDAGQPAGAVTYVVLPTANKERDK